MISGCPATSVWTPVWVVCVVAAIVSSFLPVWRLDHTTSAAIAATATPSPPNIQARSRRMASVTRLSTCPTVRPVIPATTFAWARARPSPCRRGSAAMTSTGVSKIAPSSAIAKR